VTLGVTVMVATAATASAAWIFTSRELKGETDEFLARRAVLIANLDGFEFSEEGRGRRPRGGPEVVLAEFDALSQVIGPDGRVIAEVANSGALPVTEIDLRVADSPVANRVVYRNIEIDGAEFRLLTLPLGDSRGAVQVARSLEESQQVLADLRNRMFAVGLVGAVLASVLGWVIARRTVRPVEDLTRAAEHVAATEDLAAPIIVDRTDEVGRLAEAFNTMLAALEGSRRQQHRLVMDASHELRTPLTSLRTNIEVLQRARDLDPAAREEMLGDVHSELDELTNLVTELVELATDRRESEPIQELRLDEVADAVVERARRRTDRPITLQAGEAVVVGRPQMLDRALGNLVENASKWSPDGSAIEVRVTGGEVAVRDHGPGIDPDDRPFVFDRFYRATDARSMPGSGLGLAIVKHIVDVHGGEVWVRDAEGGGAVVGFTIPAVTEEEPVTQTVGR
jgi:two-component system sensor histidine kinase MprB